MHCLRTTGAGGALALESWSAVVLRSSFWENIAQQTGGAAYISNTQAIELSHSVFEGNAALAFEGGAIRVHDAEDKFTLTQVSFVHNE